MKKSVVVLLLLLFVTGSVVAADKPLGVDEYTSVDELSMAISSYFPKVQGEVKAAQAGNLTIALGKKDGLMPGMVLSLWRDGKEILHPVTGAVIGRAEEEIGSVEITATGETSSTAVVRKKLRDPQPGDKARITPKKISLAIIPVRTDHPEIARGLAENLNESGRFTLLDSGKVSDFLKDRPQRDASLVRDLGRVFTLDAVVALGVYSAEGKLLVTTRIFYAEDARPLDTIVSLLDLKSKKDTLAEVRPFFAPVREETSSTPELPFNARFFASADFDGQGGQEYAFSDGTRLHICRLEPSGWRELWTETLPSEARDIRHFSLDAADINGNGRPEIFVSAMLDGKVFSYAVEFRDNAFRRIAELPGFLRVINYPGKGIVLIGQDYDPEAFYRGQPKQYTWSAGKYVPGPAIPLPRGLGLYGFVFASVGEPNPLLVALDDKDHVLVYSGDALIWKSEELYAGVDTMVLKPLTGIEAALSGSANDPDKGEKVRINARILALDMNGDNRDELVLPRNVGGMFAGDYKAAELHGMRWNGARLDQQWYIADIPGAIQDIQAVRQETGAIQIRALVKLPGGLFSKERLVVMTYAGK